MWQPDFTVTEHSADHHGGIAIEEAAQVAEARVAIGAEIWETHKLFPDYSTFLNPGDCSLYF